MKITDIQRRMLYPYQHKLDYRKSLPVYVVRIHDGDRMRYLFELFVYRDDHGCADVPLEDTTDYRAAKWLNEIRHEDLVLRKLSRQLGAIHVAFWSEQHAYDFVREFGGKQ